MVWGLNRGMGKDLSHLQNTQTDSGANPASYLCTVDTPYGDKVVGALN